MPDYSMPFNPNMMSLNDLASISPMKDAAMGIYGAMLPDSMKQGMMNQLPMGMMNRDGQAFMGQPQMQAPQQPAQDGMNRGDMMKLAGMAMQGFSRGQQGMPSGNTAQIIRDSNQFRFAGNPQQQMAQALRNR
jgi:hypothetical protein